jgi:acetyltransferase EpsM
MTKSIVILGAGGHGRVVADICRSIGRTVAGYLDPDATPNPSGEGNPILGGDDRLAENAFVAEHDFCIAVGDPQLRQRLAKRVLDSGGALPALAHRSAIVAPDVVLGRGTVLMAGAIVNPGCRIGEFVIINTAATVDHDGEIGDGTHLCPGAHLAGAVSCGSNVYIGVGASIIQGIHIADGAIVGAGSAVIRDVPSGLTVVGCPAQPLETKARGER